MDLADGSNDTYVIKRMNAEDIRANNYLAGYIEKSSSTLTNNYAQVQMIGEVVAESGIGHPALVEAVDLGVVDSVAAALSQDNGGSSGMPLTLTTITRSPSATRPLWLPRTPASPSSTLMLWPPASAATSSSSAPPTPALSPAGEP